MKGTDLVTKTFFGEGFRDVVVHAVLQTLLLVLRQAEGSHRHNRNLPSAHVLALVLSYPDRGCKACAHASGLQTIKQHTTR